MSIQFNYQKESQSLYELGFSVVPVKGKETLLSKGYRDKMSVGLNQPQIPSKWHLQNVGEVDGVAVLCGKYSDGLICLDFDLKNGDGEDFYSEFCSMIRDEPYWGRLIHATTPSGGKHIWWKFQGEDRKSEKLARTLGKKDLIETRGTGGYALVPPSVGYVWDGPGWAGLGILGEDETDQILSIARCMDEYVEPDTPVYTPKEGPTAGPDSPFNRFDAANTGFDILEARGFRMIRDSSTQSHFNRPGAKNRNGVDATWYKDKNEIRIWSTSTGIVQDTDRNYKPYQLLVFTHYAGDFKKAAGDLARKFNMPIIQKQEVRPPVPSKILKEEVLGTPHKRQEVFAPGLEIKNLVAERRLEGWVREKIRKEVSLTQVLIDSAIQDHIDIEPEIVGDLVRKFYEQYKDEFGEDNIKMPYLKAEHFLNKHFVIRRNSVLLSTTFLKKGSMEETNLNENSIWNLMQKSGIKVSQAQVKSMLNDPQYFKVFDPFKEYFEGLAGRKVEGAGFIQKLSEYIVVPPEVKEFWESMFRKALIRTVAGAIGNYPNRECITLCSPQQRIGKTWFIRNLSPWGTEKYFSDEIIIQNKDQMFRICQNLIYLIDEIGQRAVNEKMSDFLKMLISKQSVNERRLWENETTNLPRKVTFWGSTNLPYLYPGENTRWISIPVLDINHDYNNHITKLKEVDIDDVWAEAYQAYMSGENFELTAQERETQEFFNKDWIIGNEAMGLVDTYVQSAPDGTSWMSAEEILGLLVLSSPNIIRRVNARNLTEALRSRNIPHTYAKNAHGYKVHMFQCKVNSVAEWKGENLPK